MPKPITVRVQ